MGLFNDPQEAIRKAKLKDMEDKRCRFAQRMQEEGFAPESMLLFSGEGGGVIGLCRDGGQAYVICGPDFGAGNDFEMFRFVRSQTRREEIDEPGEGMGGVLGLGKKSARGFKLHIVCGEKEITVPAIVNRSSMLLCRRGKNLLLNVKRRRGDANIVWDLPPLDKRGLADVSEWIDEILG